MKLKYGIIIDVWNLVAPLIAIIFFEFSNINNLLSMFIFGLTFGVGLMGLSIDLDRVEKLCPRH